MDSLIETFHIDLKLLAAQAINFSIVIAVLYFFALKPLLKTMKDRSAKIEKSLEDAKKIEKKLDKTDADYRKELARAKKEAALILEQAQVRSEDRKKEMIEKAKLEIGQIINEEKAKIQHEKAVTLKEIKSEVSDLVIASVEKLLAKKMDKEEDKELIRKSIK